jgi:signal transduction histidine kinase/ActR/RegA family two-component response regulator
MQRRSQIGCCDDWLWFPDFAVDSEFISTPFMPQSPNSPDRKYMEPGAIDRTVWETPFVPETLRVWQLERELQYERCLNDLAQRLSACVTNSLETALLETPLLEIALLETATQDGRADQKFQTNSTLAPEVAIYRTLVQKLGIALRNEVVAIALPPAAKTACFTLPTVCYSTVTPGRSPSLAAINPITECWYPGYTLTHQDLQNWQQEVPGIVWQMGDGSGTNGWLLVCPKSSLSTLHALDLSSNPLRSDLIDRALKLAVHALRQVKQIQADQQQRQELKAANQELIQVNQSKSEFLANTSHEIRTPLSSILGFTRLLQQQGYQPTNPRHLEYLNVILSSGQHLLALINDILDLSKIEANQLDLQWESVNVQQVCQTALTLVREKASDKGLGLRLEIGGGISTFMADGLRLKQMLFNLLSNAIKFTLQGTVGVKVALVNQCLHFTVWDTGTGISQEQQQLLFCAYSQIPNAIVERDEGTGLGLALTQRLAELHGGRVEVSSELGQGSRFTIILPLVLPPLDAAPSPISPSQKFEGKSQITPPSSSSPSPPLNSEILALPCSTSSTVPYFRSNHLLLVEDNPFNAKLLLVYLSKLGYEVTWVKQGQEMWQALERAIPALILMDIHLPDTDGLTLTRQLQTDDRYRAVPVIATTAMAMTGDRDLCLEAGVVDYISKPLDLEKLAELIEHYRLGVRADGSSRR